MHRYCPYCGTARVLAEARPNGSIFVIGYDVISRQGTVHAYREPFEPPVPLDPLSGPWEPPLRDLYASSHAHLPENAFYDYALPDGFPTPPASAEGMVEGTVAQSALRHGRMFFLTARGEVTARSPRGLTALAEWALPQFHERGGEFCKDLWVSDTLVYTVTDQGQGNARVVAAEIGRGRLVLGREVSFVRPEVLIEGGEVLVVGEPRDGSQTVERYSLRQFADGATPPDAGRRVLSLRGDPAPVTPRPARLGRAFVVPAADGKIHWWPDGDDADPLRILWENLDRARLDPAYIPLSSNEVGYLSLSRPPERRARLLRVRADDGQPSLVSVDLDILQEANVPRVAAHQGTVYLLLQAPGQPITLYRLAAGGIKPERLVSFSSTQDGGVRNCQVIPWEGEAQVLVHYTIGAQHDLWVYNPKNGEHRPVAGHPPLQAQVEVLWETGQAWVVESQPGRDTRIKRLA